MLINLEIRTTHIHIHKPIIENEAINLKGDHTGGAGERTGKVEMTQFYYNLKNYEILLQKESC